MQSCKVRLGGLGREEIEQFVQGGLNFLAKLAQVDKFSTKDFFSNFLNSLTILLPKNPDDLFFLVISMKYASHCFHSGDKKKSKAKVGWVGSRSGGVEGRSCYN